MSHRIIISSAVQTAVQEAEVQAQLTANQQSRSMAICNGSQQPPCDDDLRYLLRCLDKAYSQDD